MYTYAICVRNNEGKNYILPMDIKDIDIAFINLGKEGVLKRMRELDSVLTETNPDNLTILKKISNKYIEEKFTNIITDPFYLTFPLEKLPLDMSKNDSLAKVLYNHLLPFQNRPSTKETYTKILEALNNNQEYFIKTFNECSYIDQRIIRSIIAYKFDVKNYLEPNKNLSLYKKSYEKAA